MFSRAKLTSGSIFNSKGLKGEGSTALRRWPHYGDTG